MESHYSTPPTSLQQHPQARFGDDTDLHTLQQPGLAAGESKNLAPVAYQSSAHMPSTNNIATHDQTQHRYSDDAYQQVPINDGSAGYGQQQLIAPSSKPRKSRLSRKNKRRLVWVIPLAIFVLIIGILFEVYKDDFERWASPLTRWLTEREAWSWVIPVVILIILSLPPLFGHEIVQLIVGLAYPLGVAIGIACAGSILGEAFCFIVFKFFGTKYVDKKIATKVKWAAISRVAQQAGFKGILVIRYSIVPPHLANPLFACTGMSFWLYMSTVILSLPKSIVFVALGSPSSKNHTGVKWAKVVALAILVAVTIFASIWIRKKLKVATAEIERERGILHDDDDDDVEHDGVHLQKQIPGNVNNTMHQGYSGTVIPYDPPQGPTSQQRY